MSRSRRKPDPAPRPLGRTPTSRVMAAARRAWANPVGRFLIRYPIFTALVFVMPVLLPSSEPWLIHATIQSLAVARILMPSAVHVAEPTFGIGGTTINIVPDCTPMFPTLLLAGGI